MTPRTLKRCCFNCKWWDFTKLEKYLIDNECNNDKSGLLYSYYYACCPHFEWLPMPEHYSITDIISAMQRVYLNPDATDGESIHACFKEFVFNKDKDVLCKALSIGFRVAFEDAIFELTGKKIGINEDGSIEWLPMPEKEEVREDEPER